MSFTDWLTDALLAHAQADRQTPYQRERALRLAEDRPLADVFNDGEERPTRADRAFLVRALKEALLCHEVEPPVVDRLESELRLATGSNRRG